MMKVEKDTERAEEYYGRAILANPGDGELLSMYGKLIWETHRDQDRAKSYFDQAVTASPDDWYSFRFHHLFIYVCVYTYIHTLIFVYLSVYMDVAVLYWGRMHTSCGKRRKTTTTMTATKKSAVKLA